MNQNINNEKPNTLKLKTLSHMTQDHDSMCTLSWPACVRTFLYVLQFKVVENLIMIVVAYVT